MASKIDPPEKISDLPLALIKNMVMLVTSGFGLVVALAWNEFVRNLVSTYISPYFGKEGGTVSLFIYALVVTIFAVLVTMQLTNVQKKLEKLDTELPNAKKEEKTSKNK